MTEHEKRIREALEAGPTDGNWITDPSNPNLVAVDSTPYEYIFEVAPSEFSDSDHEYEQEIINAAFIAACNPSAIRALLADLDAMRADAMRYRAFFTSGLPVCFEGQEYYSKADCDADIDAALKGASA